MKTDSRLNLPGEKSGVSVGKSLAVNVFKQKTEIFRFHIQKAAAKVPL
jgi:hypothetical protein